VFVASEGVNSGVEVGSDDDGSGGGREGDDWGMEFYFFLSIILNVIYMIVFEGCKFAERCLIHA